MARQQGTRGMGSHKHGVSGHAGKSPKMRMAQELEARRQERVMRAPQGSAMAPSVRGALDAASPRKKGATKKRKR